MKHTNHLTKYLAASYMETYCLSLFESRYSAKSFPFLWRQFYMVSPKFSFESTDQERLNSLFRKINFPSFLSLLLSKLGNSFSGSVVPDKNVVGQSIMKLTIRGKSLSGQKSLFGDLYDEKRTEIPWCPSEGTEKRIRVLLHIALFQFFSSLCGEKVAITFVSKVIKVARYEGNRLAEWYCKEILSKK